MSYHPIHDLWFLTRAKLKGGRKYYGAYLGGFPERARVLIGCSTQRDPGVLSDENVDRPIPKGGAR